MNNDYDLNLHIALWAGFPTALMGDTLDVIELILW